MADESHRKIINAVDDFMENLDKSHLRKLERTMHLCAADCCKDTTSSKDSVQKCVINCAQPMQKVQTRVESDMNNVQERLTRCIQGCQDKVRDSLGPKPSEGEFSKREREMEGCVTKCADEIIAMLPKTLTKCQEWIDYNVKK